MSYVPGALDAFHSDAVGFACPLRQLFSDSKCRLDGERGELLEHESSDGGIDT
jgi:hypothetical protein